MKEEKKKRAVQILHDGGAVHLLPNKMCERGSFLPVDKDLKHLTKKEIEESPGKLFGFVMHPEDMDQCQAMIVMALTPPEDLGQA